MLQLNYLPIHFTFFLIVGILVGYTFDFSLTVIFLIALVNFSGLIFFFFRADKSFKPPYIFSVFTSTLFILIGVIGMLLTKPEHQKKHYSHFLKKEKSVIISIRKILKSNNYYQKFEAEVISINKNKTKGKVLVNIEKNPVLKDLKVDDLLFTTNEFSQVNGALNPHEFDYREYLKKQNIYHQISLKREDFGLLPLQQNTLVGFAHLFRTKINERLKSKNFSEDEFSIFNAILLGQRQDISKETFEIYKNAGAIHILAVSGLHIGIILLMVNFLLKPLKIIKNGKMVKLFFVVLFLFFYAFIAGLSPSVIRAVTMFTAIAIGIALNRPSGVKNSLVVSLFFLLLIHPLFLFDVGFQLSYIAVFSIVWLQPLFQKLWKPKFKIVNYFWQLLTVSFAAQLGILPLSLFYFHQFPGLFFVSSLVIIPFLGFILGTGFLIIVLASFNILPQLSIDFYEIVIGNMNKVVAIISRQESFLFQDISFSALLLLVSYLLIIWSVRFLRNRNSKNLLAFLLGVLFFQINFFYEKAEKNKKQEFIVFQQAKKSVFVNRIKDKVFFYQNSDSLNVPVPRPVKTYIMANNKLKIQAQNPLKNYFEMNKKSILVIDSLGIYKDLKIHPEIVILTHSPKINMQRLIEILQPKIIVADGSNYKSYVKLWDNTTKNNKINFHDTSVKGAFINIY